MVKKILIIEDEIDIIAIYQIVLDGPDIEIILASNGQTGYELALSRQPDLIILDLLMPTMNGYEFLEKIRSHNELNNIPIIVASNLNSDQEKEKLKKFSINDYLTKDHINSAEILKVVHKYL